MEAVVVRWHGPYTFNQASQQTDPGLYLAWGRRRTGRPWKNPRLLYCGLSEDARGVGARVAAHQEAEWAHPDNSWWIGRVHLPAPALRRHLEVAEWGVIYFANPFFNEKKKARPPKDECYLINEWRHHDGRLRIHQKGKGAAERIPDAICWSPENEGVRHAQRLAFSRVD